MSSRLKYVATLAAAVGAAFFVTQKLIDRLGDDLGVAVCRAFAAGGER